MFPDVLRRLLREGHGQGTEYIARNPRRDDKKPGSFKINMRTGRWGDFSDAAKGGDPISLAAIVSGLSQVEAARRLSVILGLEGRRNG